MYVYGIPEMVDLGPNYVVGHIVEQLEDMGYFGHVPYSDIYENGVQVEGGTPIKKGNKYLFSKLNSMNVPSTRLFLARKLNT